MAGPYIYVFEDDNYENFHPLTVNRAVYQLRLGIDLIYQKWFSYFDGYAGRFCIRGDLAAITALKTNIPCNSFKGISDTASVFINGRYLPDFDIVSRLKAAEKSMLYLQDGNLAAAVLTPESSESTNLQAMQYWGYGHFKEILKKLPREDIEICEVRKIWDFIALNPSQIEGDFERLVTNADRRLVDEVAIVDERIALYRDDRILLGKKSRVDAGVVIDAREGPVFIDAEAHIEPHSFVQGPCYIGKKSRIVGGKIREGCSVGPVCKVGGELEESVILGHSNKFHDGFLGHAYLGEWVNLGAMTTNSDLKNNYGTIRVDLGDGQEDTGLVKAGSFVGDHVKTGIGTMLNTGIVIGFASNVFGAGLVADKYVPPFSWGSSGSFTEYKLEKAVDTAKTVMERREVEFGNLDEKLFKMIFDNSADERRARFG